MGLFGLWVIATVLWHAAHGTLPSAFTMGAVGFAALAANAAAFGLLWAYRGGDANMRSAWKLSKPPQAADIGATNAPKSTPVGIWRMA